MLDTQFDLFNDTAHKEEIKTTALKIRVLKEEEQDFEWYPTTDEILECLRKDVYGLHLHKKYEYSRRDEEIYFNGRCGYGENEKAVLFVDSFLDIGAGDGRVFKYLTKEINKRCVDIRSRYGIEKATVQGDDLIKNGVALIGRDYWETVLIDRHFTCVFSNPPYSEYKEWCIKLVKEVNAKLDSDLKQLFEACGEVSILGTFDFTDGDRSARAVADLVRIVPNDENDTFRSWVEEHIGLFQKNEAVDLDEEEEEERSNGTDDGYKVKSKKGDTVEAMIENYKEDMQNLLTTFKALGAVDWKLIAQLGVKKADVIGKVRSDITSLKSTYWRLVFNHLEEITSRLTYKMRNNILSEIKWFEELDFNDNNVRTIVIWIIENFNKYTKQQMLDVYDKITNFNTVRAYKSNDKWVEGGWRYEKKKPVKYALDYRIVVHIGYELYSYRSEWSTTIEPGNPLVDLSIVARSLGFDNYGIIYDESRYTTGKKHYCCKKSKGELFEYKIYKNDNVHLKLDKDFLRVLNIEVGKERGWLQRPKDIQDEFDISEEEAIRLFDNGRLSLINTNDQLLIGMT
jgi:hypothetical protein